MAIDAAEFAYVGFSLSKSRLVFQDQFCQPVARESS